MSERYYYATHQEYGAPVDVIQIAEGALSDLGPDEVRIRMQYSPINPADINMLEGRYIEQPPLPCVLGNEGVGVVEVLGGNVNSVQVGDAVIVPIRSERKWIGFWTQYLTAKAEDVITLPAGIDLKQAAMASVNPLTAHCLLSQFAALKPGDWIIQNSANSGLGRSIIAVAKARGLRSVNILRRDDVVADLKALGADEVFSDEPGISKTIKSKLTGESVVLALNGVGGASATELLKCLSEKGSMVTYGAMSKESVTVSNGQLIYKDLRILGFNRTRWINEANASDIREAYRAVLPLIADGSLVVPVEDDYKLEHISDALTHAQRESRQGKVLLNLS